MASVRSMPGLQRFNQKTAEYRAKVPADVADKLKGHRVTFMFPAAGANPEACPTITLGTHAKVALRTSDSSLQVARTALAIARLEGVYAAVRNGPQPLTHRQRVALSGEVYRMFVEVYRDEPGPPSYWACLKGLNRAVREGRITGDDIPTLDPRHSNDIEVASRRFGIDLTAGINNLPVSALPHDAALERRFGMLATLILDRHAIEADAATRRALLVEVEKASTDAAWALKRASEGDYTPDPKAQRFPSFENEASKPAHTITGTLDAWWREANATGRSPATYISYQATLRGFVAFVKHDELARITPEDVVGFKDHRLASTNPRTGRLISAKTVADSDLTALKSVFGWAVKNRRLANNPASGVTIDLGKPVRLRSKSFTDDEAKALLQAAGVRTRGREHQKTFEAVRWAPWLMAYTGCRVGEFAQLRKQDVRKLGEHWVIHITPEAGTVKDKEARDVVLHQHLVELGFPAFAMAAGEGHIFLDPAKDGDVLGPLQGVVNRITEAARRVVTDRRVGPNHGWRHRFRTICRTVHIDRAVSFAITGHDNEDVGDDYGDVTLDAQARALASFPRQG